MHIETLREFIVFSQYLNFSTAANALHISQPALSNHIAGLEKELGVTLVNRTPPISLTAVGKAFFEESNEIISSLDSMISKCQSLENDSEAGSITIKTPMTSSIVGMKFLDCIASFKTLYPAITVNSVTAYNQNLFDKIRSGDIDCGITYNYRGTSEPLEQGRQLKFIPFMRVPLRLQAHREHPLATKEALSVADLAGYTFPMLNSVSHLELEVSGSSIFIDHGVAPPHYFYRAADSLDDYFFSLRKNEIVFRAPGVHSFNGFIVRSFTPETYQTIHLAVLEKAINPAVTHFLEYIELYQSNQRKQPDGILDFEPSHFPVQESGCLIKKSTE